MNTDFVISLGLGSPSSIARFITFGLGAAPVPSGRTYTVLADERSYLTPADERNYLPSADERTYTVPGE